MEEGEQAERVAAGRALVRLRKTTPGSCAWPPCGVTWDDGRPDKRYCSKKHAMRASRARRRTGTPMLLEMAPSPPDVERCTDEVTRRLEQCLEEATERMRRCSRQAIEDFRRCIGRSAGRELVAAAPSAN